ncbi:MAG: hypothetical protein A3G24_11540 [Betaproteobacteria bacterium RIFCSPLOWO2_12_FULL_62_13]|nr:MAG: hypothetical protein A3G24_11540 [Betaproteobacteria bacterium RIFCSPLOWO2_12_FULL_62_13]
MKSRNFAAVALVMLGLQAGAAAQSRLHTSDSDYPSRPIRIVAGWPAGGGSDHIARIVAKHLTEGLGQQVIIDNRPGAGHTIALTIVANASPDGHTLQMVNANYTLNPFIYGKQPYDIKRDFAPVTQVVSHPLVLVVSASLPVASLKDLIAMAKAKPGALSAGTGGTAGAGAVTTEMFRYVSGTDFVTVPYKGGAQAQLAVVQGEVQFMIGTMTTTMPAIQSGKLKVLATSSKRRLPFFPDVPTFVESGLAGLDIRPWEGIVAPAKTPRPVIDRLHGEVVKMLKLPDIQAQLAKTSSEPIGSTPAEFSTQIQHQLQLFARIFRGGKIVGGSR